MIGQTGEGLPDDTSRPVYVDDSTIDAVPKKLGNDPREDLLKEVKQEEDAHASVLNETAGDDEPGP